MITSIYELIDPRDGLTYYVGKTHHDVEFHVYGHMSGVSRRSGGTVGVRAKAWMRGLLVNDLWPTVRVLETIEGDEWEWREGEQRWIKQRKDEGHPLTNMNSGGAGKKSATHRPTPAELGALTRADRDGLFSRGVDETRERRAFIDVIRKTGSEERARENAVVLRDAQAAWSAAREARLAPVFRRMDEVFPPPGRKPADA